MGHTRDNIKVRLGGMLAITQFEVYVLAQGRWSLHARYPSEERKEAILDARTTEVSTGLPTKVVRETYFPETNDTETITTYVSPKARALKSDPPGRKPQPLRAATNVLGRRRRRAPKTPASISNTVFRVIVASAISLVAATLMVLVVDWALGRLTQAGVAIAPDLMTTILTYSYVLMFLFFFFSLFRSRLPLHRLLADLWQKTTANAQISATAATATYTGPPPKLKPKHARNAAEALREYEDLKVKRGDLDAAKPPEIQEAPPVEVAPAPQPEQKEAAKPEDKKAEAKKAEEKQKAAEKKAKEEKQAKEKAEQEKQQPATPAAVREETGFDQLNLERMILRRFAGDAVKAAAAGSMPNDPVTRRGAALVLMGAAAGVASTANLGPAAEVELLVDAQRHFGIPEATIDLFMTQYAELAAIPMNALLVTAGRTAIAAYLEGRDGIVPMLARALAAWRTPFGQPGPAILGDGASTPFEQASFETVPLVDVYLLSELRETPAAAPMTSSETAAMDAAHDEIMGAHNSVVRTHLMAHGGHEVKHTGKGIFARFMTARDAVGAATDIARHFPSGGFGPKIAMAVIGNTMAGEDPILSAALIHRAQDVIARAKDGEIICEPQVHAAAGTPSGAVLADPAAPAPDDVPNADAVKVVVDDGGAPPPSAP